ncbi:MAG: glycoside hydrolase family 5 protein [Bacteroidales bacterium]
MTKYKGIPKTMRWVIGFLALIIIGEGVYLFMKGTSKSAEITTASTASAAPVVRLSVSGTKLTADGQPVRFKGISLGWHNIWPRFYNENCVKRLSSDWGARMFRAAIGADSHAKTDNPECHDGYIDDPAFALEHLYAAVDGAIASGSYILVDWHSHNLHLEAAKDFFTKVATRYKGVPNVIYELFNEPVSADYEKDGTFDDLSSNEAMAAYWKELKSYAESLIKVITEIDGSKPLILMGCPCWDQRIDLPACDPIGGYDNLMYTVHFYAASHKDSLRESCDKALAAGTPIFISECASCVSDGKGAMDVESWEKWDDWAAANGVSMIAWSISDKDETCSMLTKDASSEGPWNEDVIKPWGQFVKSWIK